MVMHVGEHTESVLFIGGPLDGQRKQFCPEMMADFYRHRSADADTFYRLRRVANPARTGRGWIDLQFVCDESSTS